jgi:hypothetical protein
MENRPPAGGRTATAAVTGSRKPWIGCWRAWLVARERPLSPDACRLLLQQRVAGQVVEGLPQGNPDLASGCVAPACVLDVAHRRPRCNGRRGSLQPGGEGIPGVVDTVHSLDRSEYEVGRGRPECLSQERTCSRAVPQVVTPTLPVKLPARSVASQSKTMTMARRARSRARARVTAWSEPPGRIGGNHRASLPP